MLSFYQSAHLAPSFPLIASSRLFFPHFPHSLSSFPHLPRVPQAGSRSPAQTPPRERGGGHHARGRAGSRRLPSQRPARALPHPGSHAPLPQHAAHWIQGCRGQPGCLGATGGPGPGGPGGRGLEAAGYTRDVFWADPDVAFVGARLPAPQELDTLVRNADLSCPYGCAPAKGVARAVPGYALLQ